MTAIDKMKKSMKLNDADIDVDLEMNRFIKGIYEHDLDEEGMSEQAFELYTNIKNEHEAYLNEGTGREQLRKLFEFDCPEAPPGTITSVCDTLVESYLEDGEVSDFLRDSLRAKISSDEAYESMIALVQQIIDEG